MESAGTGERGKAQNQGNAGPGESGKAGTKETGESGKVTKNKCISSPFKEFAILV